MAKILCIYALHEVNLNVEYFIKHGVVDDPQIDFYFGVNDPDLKLEVPGATVINRENVNFDFGAWSEILFSDSLYTKYDYFIFINSSVRGPFYPVWYKGRDWYRLFIDRLTDDLKLFGIMIGTMGQRIPHVQSMFMVTNRIGLQIGIDAKIFDPNQNKLNMFETVMTKEIGYSKAVLEAGYNIGCMLKLFDGIDFRKDIPDWPGFFDDNSYCGINIHPYETIFYKFPSRSIRFYGKNIFTGNLFTNWTEGRRSPFLGFSWVYYLVNNPDLLTSGLLTKEAALNHYNRHGQHEGRVGCHFPTYPKTYVVNLNPLLTSGLINQLYSLVNAILIGHFTGRNIAVDFFYPDFNLPNKIPIHKIIDIHRLNCVILESGLFSQVTFVDTSVSGWCYPDKLCPNSQHFNPTKEVLTKNGFIKTLSLLKGETKRLLNLGDTFSDTMFRTNADPDLRQLFILLLTGIPFTQPILNVVGKVKEDLDLTEPYIGVHLRLEDDILVNLITDRVRQYSDESDLMYKHGQMMFEKFKEKIASCVKGRKLFLATHLTKGEYLMNSAVAELETLYPGRVMINRDWREQFPTFHKGREIDALIDYLICMKSSSFVGWDPSTYSQAIRLSSQEYINVHFDLQTRPPDQTLLYRIVSSKCGHGLVECSRKIGYNAEYEGMPVARIPLIEEGLFTISAHTPSEVTIEVKRLVRICGHCSVTSKTPPIITFKIDRNILGKSERAGDRTEWRSLQPGIHTLVADPSARDWAHAVWLFSI